MAFFFQAVAAVALGLSLPVNVAGVDASQSPAALLKAAIEDACSRTNPDSWKTRGPTFQATLVEGSPIIVRGITSGWRHRFNIIHGGTLRIERIAPQGQLRRLSAEYLEPSGAGHRPHMLAVAGPDCLIAAGRRLHYDSEGRQSTLEHLNRDLAPTGVTEPLNPPIPSGKDPGGTSVAIVDAGVNYELPEIAARLARDADGEILGYDYWELDERPFDVHPVPSIYFPRRHGTRVASVILREAPTARLIPYRYPRPMMVRMKDLVEDASSKGNIIVNLSLGSNNESDWHALEEAIETHPHMLFIVSAGNNGRDIDANPVYPAALPQPNILTVTSAEVSGDLAPGSNWGPQSVDVLVPGEGLPVLEFNGRTGLASGSSYAAARVSGLAAQLLAEHPQWQSGELKEAIVALAKPPDSGEPKHVAHGFIADTTVPLAKNALSIRKLKTEELSVDGTYPQQQTSTKFTHALTPSFVYFANTGWSRSTILRATRKAASILAQCGVYIPSVRLHQLDTPERFRDFSVPLAVDLLSRVDISRPSVFFVRDTLQPIDYDAEAFGQSNTVTRPILRDTVWITEAVPHPGVAVAHELVHILADSGEHVHEPDNLMRERTGSRNLHLTQTQCKRVTHVGNRNGLLALSAEPHQSH